MTREHTKERPTGKLRWVTRNGEAILQLQFEVTDFYTNAVGDYDHEHTYEWRDVPSFDHDPGRFRS